MMRGFSIIGTIFIISLIGLGVSVIFASTNGGNRSERNASRNANVEKIKTAFVLVKNTNGTFPTSGGTYLCVSARCSGVWSRYTSSASLDSLLAPYTQKPADTLDDNRPASGVLYFDAGAWAGTSGFPAGYYLTWLLEAGPDAYGACGPGEYYNAGTKHIQCVLRLQ